MLPLGSSPHRAALLLSFCGQAECELAGVYLFSCRRAHHTHQSHSYFSSNVSNIPKSNEIIAKEECNVSVYRNRLLYIFFSLTETWHFLIVSTALFWLESHHLVLSVFRPSARNVAFGFWLFVPVNS